MTLTSRYARFLKDLEKVSEKHDELTDTDVRERLREVVNYYFVLDKPVENDFPKRYDMSSKAGDRAVAKLVRAFIDDAKKLSFQANIAPGIPRNNVLEDSSIRTKGGNTYDVFIGAVAEPLPDSKPASDQEFMYEEDIDSGVPIRNDKFLGPFEFTLDGRLAKVEYDYETREYACWVRGVPGHAFVSGATKEEILKKATESLTLFVDMSKKMGRA